MSATTICPHPQRCGGVRSHQVGTAAAQRCRLATGAGGPVPVGAGPPPPATLGRSDDHEDLLAAALAQCPLAHGGTKAAITAALKADDAKTGWKPRSGAAHPSGGYVRRSVRSDSGDPSRAVTLHCSDEGGRPHRDDGPAVVEYDMSGLARQAYWCQNGEMHRDDGPAKIGSGGVLGFYLRGVELPYPSAGRPGWPSAEQRYTSLTGAGCSPAEAVRWMQVQRDAARAMADSQGEGADFGGRISARAGAAWEMVDSLVAAGVGVDDALAAWGTGAPKASMQAQDVRAVLAGELPMSWAAAGA